jgi:hypothetical protein
MPTPMRVARYGWRPDLPDERDMHFDAPARTLVALPPVVDLRTVDPNFTINGQPVPLIGQPPIRDQGDVGSCSNGWGDLGYFYMPYQYAVSQRLCSDFWTLRKVMI